MDQNGIKFLADKYLLELEKTRQTDFLYFVSSSYYWRFGDKEEFKSHFDVDMAEAKKDPYQFIHRSILKQLRDRIPVGSKLRLYPFSIKKGANIFGIIFGATHPIAVDKFLGIAWHRSPANGEANFDIDDDERKNQGHLFQKTLKKIERFGESVREKVLNSDITNNFQAYNYAIEEGHIGKHASDVVQKMKKDGEITFVGKSPLVTYENAYKLKRNLDYCVLRK